MSIDARVILRGTATLTLTVATCGYAAAQAQAQHACDAIGERGWRTVASVETVQQIDNAPRQQGPEWIVERAITQLPFCNYYNSVGNYSLRSYTLSPETRSERIVICRHDAQGVSVAVAPYAGPCPP